MRTRKNKGNIVDINHQNKRPTRYIDYKKNEEQVEEIGRDKQEDEKADKKR